MAFFIYYMKRTQYQHKKQKNQNNETYSFLHRKVNMNNSNNEQNSKRQKKNEYKEEHSFQDS